MPAPTTTTDSPLIYKNSIVSIQCDYWSSASHYSCFLDCEWLRITGKALFHLKEFISSPKYLMNVKDLSAFDGMCAISVTFFCHDNNSSLEISEVLSWESVGWSPWEILQNFTDEKVHSHWAIKRMSLFYICVLVQAFLVINYLFNSYTCIPLY